MLRLAKYLKSNFQIHENFSKDQLIYINSQGKAKVIPSKNTWIYTADTIIFYAILLGFWGASIASYRKLKQDQIEFKNEIRSDFKGLRADINEFKTEMNEFKKEVKDEISVLMNKIIKIETRTKDKWDMVK